VVPPAAYVGEGAHSGGGGAGRGQITWGARMQTPSQQGEEEGVRKRMGWRACLKGVNEEGWLAPKSLATRRTPNKVPSNAAETPAASAAPAAAAAARARTCLFKFCRLLFPTPGLSPLGRRVGQRRGLEGGRRRRRCRRQPLSSFFCRGRRGPPSTRRRRRSTQKL
jgi:hypothetical protein